MELEDLRCWWLAVNSICHPAWAGYEFGPIHDWEWDLRYELEKLEPSTHSSDSYAEASIQDVVDADDEGDWN